MDATTFGGTPAAIVLASLVEKEPRYFQSKFSRYYSSITYTLRALKEISDSDVRSKMLWLYLDSVFKVIDSKLWNDKIKTFTKNVLMFRVRKYLKLEGSS